MWAKCRWATIRFSQFQDKTTFLGCHSVILLGFHVRLDEGKMAEMERVIDYAVEGDSEPRVNEVGTSTDGSRPEPAPQSLRTSGFHVPSTTLETDVGRIANDPQHT